MSPRGPISGNDQMNAFYAKEDSKPANSRRPLILPALQRFRMPPVERIESQLFQFFFESITGGCVASIEVPCGLLRQQDAVTAHLVIEFSGTVSPRWCFSSA